MYITAEQLKPLCPQRLINQALDDSGDADTSALLSALISAAEVRVHAILGPDWPAPLPAPVPAVVTDSACIFAVYELYARNGFKDSENPRAKDAEEAAKRLAPYASGDRPLYPAEDADAAAEANVISEPNALNSQYPMV